ncbi:Retrovirus-related Pol polyprotein from transposon TNT 1-94 [Trametes pubescens]|uniref:Retrovirus-related Pol polyprotein from transposon TNT 1-94 n=1 Tax=Trametes pubescens TaxID=154538 RepID=A0A1M2VYJ1_TRAPU|nr:Retrovirus-related Pol polyprotein from transposon TNT 1-94 [Trametes pubescens]
MSPTILKLNETNYAEWAMLMEALLVRKGLWDVASGEETRPLGSDNAKAVKAWKRKTAEARAEIVLNIEPSELPHVRSQDAAEVWENLRAIHQARGFGTRLSRRRAFFQMAMHRDQSMSAWIADVRRAAFQLAEIGANLDDEDTILVLTSGLPPSYEQFVVTLDATPADSLTLDYVVARLLNEESRQTPAAPSSSAHTENVLVAAAARPRVPISMITCYRCAQKGHYQANCPLAPAAPVAAATAAFAGSARLVVEDDECAF